MKNQVTLNDKTFELFISKHDIDQVVLEIGERLNNDLCDSNPIFLVILNGAFVFAADVLRCFKYECDISFVKLSSYVGTKTTHVVRDLIGLDVNVKDRTVVVIEDIIDTGITMGHIIEMLEKLGAKEVKLAALLHKPKALKKPIDIEYAGIEIPNDFIVGVGLDYNGKGRNLPEIYKIVNPEDE